MGYLRGVARAATLMLALAAVDASAATHTVDFDAFPAGAEIVTEYPGVVFPDDPPPQTIALGAATQSPANALRSDGHPFSWLLPQSGQLASGAGAAWCRSTAEKIPTMSRQLRQTRGSTQPCIPQPSCTSAR